MQDKGDRTKERAGGGGGRVCVCRQLGPDGGRPACSSCGMEAEVGGEEGVWLVRHSTIDGDGIFSSLGRVNGQRAESSVQWWPGR